MGKLRASAGEVSLEPPVGGYMSGFAARVDPATGIHDANMARAVLMDSGDTMLAIVSCDVLCLKASVVESIRERIAAKSPIEPENVFICCTHTHSGPTATKLRGVLGIVDEAWLEKCQQTIADLVISLPAKLRPALLAHASTTVTGIGFNRQDRSHGIDEELNVISLETESGDAIATLLNYATHAVVLGPSNLLYSGDFPAAAARRIAAARGGVGLYLQGACGDANPICQRSETGEFDPFERCEEIGATLAGAAVEALEGAPRVSDADIRTARKTAHVPLDPPPTMEDLDAQMAQFEIDRKEALAKQPVDRVAEKIAVAYQVWGNELREKMLSNTVPTHLPVDIYAAAINDIRIVGLPFETYSDIGKGIKQGLKPLKGMFVGYANGIWGYCPTGWAKDQGGYGADFGSARWFSALVTPVGYGADAVLIDEGTALGRSV